MLVPSAADKNNVYGEEQMIMAAEEGEEEGEDEIHEEEAEVDHPINIYDEFDDEEEEEGEYIPNSSSDTPNAHTIVDGESEEFQIQE